MSAMGPGCVKTHTEKRCGKYNSLAWRRITLTEYASTLTRRNCFKMFYACEARRSFHTAWVINRKVQIEHFSSASFRRKRTLALPRRPKRCLASSRLSATPPLGPCDDGGARVRKALVPTTASYTAPIVSRVFREECRADGSPFLSTEPRRSFACRLPAWEGPP
jgi:hypothetical protein